MNDEIDEVQSLVNRRSIYGVISIIGAAFSIVSFIINALIIFNIINPYFTITIVMSTIGLIGSAIGWLKSKSISKKIDKRIAFYFENRTILYGENSFHFTGIKDNEND